jgi:tetratricopeptide (TPR) repeat protein
MPDQTLPPADRQAILQQLRELMDARLVVAVTAEAFAFRHALTREAVYATLLKRQRATMHELVAETLESSCGSEAERSARVADLAHHYREAANWPKALEYAQQAAEQAQARYAPHEAAEYFSRAIEAAAQLGQPPSLPLLRGRGQAYELLGEFERARADYEQGLGLAAAARTAGAAGAAGAARAEWQALLDLGFLWSSRDYARTGDYLQQALALARAEGDPVTIAHSLNRVGNWLTNTGRVVEGLQCHQEALEIFRKQGSQAEMAATEDLLGLAFTLIGDIRSAQARVEQAVALFRLTDDKRGLISSLIARSALISNCDTLPWTRQTLPDCRQDAAEALALARQIGWLAGQSEIHWLFGYILGAFGEFGEALAEASASLTLANEIEHREWMVAAQCTLGQIELRLLQPEIALGHIEAARRLASELSSVWWISYTSAFMALAHVQLGQAAAAQAELRQAARRLGLEPGWERRAPGNLIERNLAWTWGEAALASGQPDEALALANRLIASANNPDGEPIPNLHRLQGAALMALEQPAAAQASLSFALQGAREHQAQPALWQIQRDLGRLARRLGQPDEARREFDAARAVIDRLAGALEAGPPRQAFLTRALSQLE